MVRQKVQMQAPTIAQPQFGFSSVFAPSNMYDHSKVSKVTPEVISLSPPSMVTFTIKEYQGRAYVHMNNGKDKVTLKEYEVRDVYEAFLEVVDKVELVKKKIKMLNIQRNEVGQNYTVIPHVKTPEEYEQEDSDVPKVRKANKRRALVKPDTVALPKKKKRNLQLMLPDSDTEDCTDTQQPIEDEEAEDSGVEMEADTVVSTPVRKARHKKID